MSWRRVVVCALRHLCSTPSSHRMIAPSQMFRTEHVSTASQILKPKLPSTERSQKEAMQGKGDNKAVLRQKGIALVRELKHLGTLGNPKLILRRIAIARSQGVPSDVRVFNAAISALGRVRAPQYALIILRGMTAQGVEPSIVSYNAAMDAYAIAGDKESALEILAELDASKKLRPDATSFNTAIKACARAGDHRSAMRLLRLAEARGLSPGLYGYNAAMSACARAGDVAAVVEVFEGMKAARVTPDVVSFTSLIRTCRNVDSNATSAAAAAAAATTSAAALNPAAAVNAADGETTDGISRGAGSVTAAFAAMAALRGAGLHPDRHAYAAVLCAAAAAGDAVAVRSTLIDAGHDGVRIGPVERTEAVDACLAGRHWQVALKLVDGIREGGARIERPAYAALLNVLDAAGEDALMDQVYARAVQETAVSHWHRPAQLKLAGFGIGMSKAAVRCALADMAAGMAYDPAWGVDLVIRFEWKYDGRGGAGGGQRQGKPPQQQRLREQQRQRPPPSTPSLPPPRRRHGNGPMCDEQSCRAAVVRMLASAEPPLRATTDPQTPSRLRVAAKAVAAWLAARRARPPAQQPP